MTLSALKSTSKRGNQSATSTSTNDASKSSQYTKKNSRESLNRKKAPMRISRSASSFSDASLELFNKRDNPLFWTDVSPCSDEELTIKIVKLCDVSSNSNVSTADIGPDNRWSGRPISKNSDVGGKLCNGRGRIGIGRSLSGVDSCRRGRSESGGYYGNCKNKHEEDHGIVSDCKSKSKFDFNLIRGDSSRNDKVARSASDNSTQLLKGWPTWSHRHPACETSSDSAVSVSCSRTFNSEDRGSPSSISEAEEQIIPVSEHVKVVQNSGSLVSGSANVIDFPPAFMNLSAEESVADVRGEYARKLGESQERARKLRAELAVEEHRELELSEIIKKMIIDQNMQKPRAGRKASIERRKVSTRLEEDAMAYFNECVSISTFDGSELSSVEDPPLSTVEIRDGEILLEGDMLCCGTTDSLRGRNERTGNFSFGMKSSNASVLQQDIRNYVKLFSKEDDKKGGSNYKDAYASNFSAEKSLMDRMELRNRIESGSLLLCSGSWESSWVPFAPFFL